MSASDWQQVDRWIADIMLSFTDHTLTPAGAYSQREAARHKIKSAFERVRTAPPQEDAERAQQLHRIEQRFFSSVMRAVHSASDLHFKGGVLAAINERREAIAGLPPLTGPKVIPSTPSSAPTTRGYRSVQSVMQALGMPPVSDELHQQRIDEETGSFGLTDDTDALLREADDALEATRHWYGWPDLVQRLVSALRESRARAEQIGKDRAIAWSEANGLTEHHYAVVEPELASLRARVEAAERDLADIRKICEEHGITDRIAGMECTVVGMVGKLAGLCSLRHEQREVTRRLLAEATTRIAQLEQSLALSEDKVKALREEVVGLPRYRPAFENESGSLTQSEKGHWLERAAVLSAIDRTLAASLTQQGDPSD